jgi:hypothetical protein
MSFGVTNHAPDSILDLSVLLLTTLVASTQWAKLIGSFPSGGR